MTSQSQWRLRQSWPSHYSRGPALPGFFPMSYLLLEHHHEARGRAEASDLLAGMQGSIAYRKPATCVQGVRLPYVMPSASQLRARVHTIVLDRCRCADRASCAARRRFSARRTRAQIETRDVSRPTRLA